MLAKRIIPCLDVKEGRVVKGISFVNLRDAGDPVEQAKIYDKEGADELVFLDITASHEKRSIMIDVVRKVAECVFIPFTVGGGLRALSDIREMLKAGADKISINTSAVQNPQLIRGAAEKFGSQCIVIAIDAKRKEKTTAARKLQWEVYVHGGRTPTGLDAVKWAKQAEKLGAGEILLTSMDKDGRQDGYDVKLTREISDAVKIPVIASGGAGNLKHLCDAIQKGRADAVLCASIFHYKTYSIAQTKKYLKRRGIPVRM